MPKDPELTFCFLLNLNDVIIHEGVYTFPDAPTERGRKHLNDLIKMKQEGYRSVLLFLILRSDAEGFKPASHIDSEYANTLKLAQDKGVELLAYSSVITAHDIDIGCRIEFTL